MSDLPEISVLDRTGEEIDITEIPDLFAAIQNLEAHGYHAQSTLVRKTWVQAHAMHDAILAIEKAKIKKPRRKHK